MNINENLILIKDEDKTENIIYCKYINSKYQVTYPNNKIYNYNYNNVKWQTKPKHYNPETTAIYEKGNPISGIIKILEFETHIRLCFKTGFHKAYEKSTITLEETCLSDETNINCFQYLKELADSKQKLKDEEKSFLSRQYDKLKLISPRSVLATYLNGSNSKNKNKNIHPIFPFGFNLSQKSATEKAFTKQISVIEGPPGTGKTQTILNIIANAIMNNETVAVVSNNNSATANVFEKLEKYNVDFIAASLGNKDNKEKFIENQKLSYPDMTGWIMDSQKINDIKANLINTGNELDKKLESQNKVAILKEEVSQHDIQRKTFEKEYGEVYKKAIPYRSFFSKSPRKILALITEFENIIEKGRGFSWKLKLKNFIIHGIFTFKFYTNSSEAVITYLQNLYYELRLKELNNEIDILLKELERFNFELVMKEYSKDSMKILKAKLAEKYKNTASKQIFSKDDLWKNFEAFIKAYPVILSTTHSLRTCIKENYLFDYVIVDEASQVDIITGALALSCGENVIVVGDLKQLPNVISQEEKETSKRIFEKYNLKLAYNYADYNLLSSITKLFKDVPKTMLKEHYRCNPKIIGFCNQKFYNNELIILTNKTAEDMPLMVYKTAKGNHARGTFNKRQIDVIKEEVLPYLKIAESTDSLGIISPYRAQANHLNIEKGMEDIEADTVHKYQGREKDIIILTTVANEINDFVDNANLINVAISRAVKKLVVVVSDDDSYSKNSNIGDLIKYISYNNLEIINSNIRSIFDLLYGELTKERVKLLKNSRNVSEYASENLMNTVIEKVLEHAEFHNLGRVMHMPLKSLIRNTSKLNDIELKFVMNPNTHTDFIIYNKMDKMPVLVVEVDGYKYHGNNLKQLERDRIKDGILEKYGIPILRVGTNESGEEKRLRDMLLN